MQNLRKIINLNLLLCMTICASSRPYEQLYCLVKLVISGACLHYVYRASVNKDDYHERVWCPKLHIHRRVCIPISSRTLSACIPAQATRAFAIPSARFSSPSSRDGRAAAAAATQLLPAGRRAHPRPSAHPVRCRPCLAPSRSARDGMASYVDFVVTRRRTLALTEFHNILRTPIIDDDDVRILRGEGASQPFPILPPRRTPPPTYITLAVVSTCQYSAVLGKLHLGSNVSELQVEFLK